MKCELFMNRFLEKDHDDRLSAAMRLHLRGCPRCGKEVAAFNGAIDELRAFEAYTLDEIASAHIVHMVMQQPEYRKSISLFNWLGAGVVLFVSLFLAPFGDDFLRMRDRFGGNLEVPFSLVMGVLISIYAAVFIGTHLDGFARWMEHRK